MKKKLFSLILLSIFSFSMVGAQNMPNQMGGNMHGDGPMGMFRPFLSKFKLFAKQAGSVNPNLKSAINDECVGPFQEAMKEFSEMDFKEGPPDFEGIEEDIETCKEAISPFTQSNDNSRKGKKALSIAKKALDQANKLKNIVGQMSEMAKEGESMMEEGLKSGQEMMRERMAEEKQRMRDRIIEQKQQRTEEMNRQKERMTQEQEYRKQYEEKMQRQGSNFRGPGFGEYGGPPPGWDQGNKQGWGNGNQPPGYGGTFGEPWNSQNGHQQVTDQQQLPPPPPPPPPPSSEPPPPQPTSGSLFDIFVSWLHNGR